MKKAPAKAQVHAALLGCIYITPIRLFIDTPVSSLLNKAGMAESKTEQAENIVMQSG